LRTLFLLVVAALGLAPDAHAQWQSKTMRDPLPGREVERPLVLPKGWVQISFGYDQHLGVGQWTPEGKVERFDQAHWQLHTEHVRIAYGVSKNAELWWTIPFHQALLTNDDWDDDEALFDHSLGDQYFGWRLHILHTEAPASSWMFDTWYKAPTAQESPANYIGGPLNVSNIIFTTGTPDWYLGTAYKRQFGPIAATATAGYLHRFSSVVQYLVELNEFQFNGRMKPGDQVRLQLEVMLQAGPLAIGVRPEYEVRLKTKMGTTSGDFLNPNRNRDVVPGSGGQALDLRSWVKLNATRGFDVAGYYVHPLLGEDLLFFPIEDLHPTYGPTFGGFVEARF